MNSTIRNITNRLSLRKPQEESLEILARVVEKVRPEKGADSQTALEAIRSEFASVEDFEREFPSICFALATGVGKTRLMGAFMAYLYLEKRIRHFFVLAPTLTIYNKLIGDFTPGNPKYVLNGIAEFANDPPEIITGDNYESGRGTRMQTSIYGSVHVNIFNISKINTEVRGGKAPRIKRLAECIGQSYFDYLAGLPDLVLIMDESHRYRADAGVRVLNELNPILGLELTATPQVEVGSKDPVPFRNIIYSYPLSNAIRDGFVKEPAVATRENFEADSFNGKDGEARLERLKLEDGIRVHEATKVELETYARNHDLPIVKPFMLVVAQDTTHANQLLQVVEDDAFFAGRYKGRVITVHSNQKGEEKDETVERLLAVERRDEPTEIVIHVDMLKEGWDVTNLYTIVPLRKANSRTLVEQSIGRGLRLPYGRRVGTSAVDRLTIVSHDHFQEIIDEANRPGSIIRTGIVIGRDIPLERKEVVVIPSVIEAALKAPSMTEPVSGVEQKPLFLEPEEQKIASVAFDVFRDYEKLPRSYDMTKPEVHASIVREVRARYEVGQLALEGVQEKPDVEAVVSKAIELFVERSIDIPRIVVVPAGEVTSGFHDFNLDTRSIRYQPVAHDILIHHLQSNAREKLVSGEGIVEEARLEDYVVRALMDFDDISYDDHADLLYKLAGDVVAHLHTYLKDEAAIANVLQYYQRALAELVHAQLAEHYWEKQAGFDVRVSKGFSTLRPNNVTKAEGEKPRSFRAPIDDKQFIRRMLFSGFQKCLYPIEKFQSDTERRFAVLVEDDPDTLKWFKPAPGQFRISYRYGRAEHDYEPDFVVETRAAKLMCEPKAENEISNPEVQSKAAAGARWCKHATDHETKHGGRPWSYLLIPHTEISAAKTLAGLTSKYRIEDGS